MTTSAPARGVLSLACCLLLSSCIQTPPAVPLDPDAVLADVRAEREEAPTPEGQPLTLAEATALSFTKPLFMVVLAALLLHETVRARRWSAA